MVIHTVKEGDTVYKIAKKYNVCPTKILEDNDLNTTDRLAVGEKLIILFPTKCYTVKSGDTLQALAEHFHLPLRVLYQNNPALRGEDALYTGQLLTLEYPDKPYGSLSVNGYAYPHVDLSTLRRTLPYLTYLTVFSGRVRSDGNLLLPDDRILLAESAKYGVAPLLLLTNISEKGGYSRDCAREILTNPVARVTMLDRLKEALQERRYAGVDFDFEYVPAELAESYANLIEDARTRLGAEGFCVFASCAPKGASDERNALCEGHSYHSLGQAADFVRLMSYEWGSAYSPPMPISPLPQFLCVANYACSQISPRKISLGMASFGYDRALPHVAGRKAESLSYTDALRLAAKKNIRIEYDEKNQAPYFDYDEISERNSVRHTVYFEDAESIHAKLALAGELGVSGVSLWNIMQYFPHFHLLVNALFDIVRPFPCRAND